MPRHRSRKFGTFDCSWATNELIIRLNRFDNDLHKSFDGKDRFMRTLLSDINYFVNILSLHGCPDYINEYNQRVALYEQSLLNYNQETHGIKGTIEAIFSILESDTPIGRIEISPKLPNRSKLIAMIHRYNDLRRRLSPQTARQQVLDEYLPMLIY